MTYLGIFRLEFLKKLLSYSKSTPSNFSKMSFYTVNAVNFGIGYAFSRGPGPSFFLRSGSGSAL